MKKAKLFIILLITASLFGCSFGSSIDSLMTPPKLSMEQEQIYSALTDAAGSSIRLKYPKSGNFLSAFIVEDIDGDGGAEAVVFYEKNSLALEENTLRINILDQFDGKWRSVCDTPADGSEIEKVMISKLGSNDRINLIIGSSLINRTEKNVSIYSYSDGTIERNFNSAYSFMDVTDLDKDGENEFLLLSGAASASPATAEAYKLDDEGMYYRFTRELSGNFSEFDSLAYGEINNGVTGLYIDAVSGTGMIQTDIIYMDESGLNKVFSSPEESLATIRPSGCSSYDVDGDGILEIPVQTISKGYENTSESEQMKITNWLFINDKNKLEQKYSSYYSVNEGYIFLFPEKWRNRVTLKLDAVNDEIVFCAYENNEIGRELLRIYCAEDSASREDRISGGYVLVHTKGELAYLVYTAHPEEDKDGDGLGLNAADAAVYFKYRE